MKQILVSPEDEWMLSEYPWRFDRNSYVCFMKTEDGRKATVYLHRLVANAPSGMLVDHADGNPLNNRRENLRICTHADNMKNRKIRRDNRSGFKGVYVDKKTGRFRAEIRAEGRKHHLGCFGTPSEAFAAYQAAAKRLHGEFARFK